MMATDATTGSPPPGGRLKMSARDAARVLGLSHQRVHQLAQDVARFARPSR